MQELLAYGSYLALVGTATGKGDGIIPVAASRMEGAVNIEIGGNSDSSDSSDGKNHQQQQQQCYHSNFLPTPVGKAVTFRNLPWYGSEGNIEKWIEYLNI